MKRYFDQALTIFTLLSPTAQNFGIVEPYPKNIYPIEFTSAKVTCVAYDPSGIKIPEKILFWRRNRYADYMEIKPNENLFLERRNEEVLISGGYTRFFLIQFNLTLVIQFNESEGYHRFSPSRLSSQSRMLLSESRGKKTRNRLKLIPHTELYGMTLGRRVEVSCQRWKARLITAKLS